MALSYTASKTTAITVYRLHTLSRARHMRGADHSDPWVGMRHAPDRAMDTRSGPAVLAIALLCGSLGEGIAFADDAPIRPDTTGFYPLWEGTAHVEANADVHLGTTGAQIGIGDLAHVGVQPINYLFRTPNAYVKVPFFDSGGWYVAAQVGGYRLLEGASRAFYSPMFSSRLDNPDFAVNLVPVSLSMSVEITRWLELHQTLTGLGIVASAPLANEVKVGYAAIAEFLPHEHHAISIHAGEIGFWAHELAYVGASYRYRSGWLELRIGYFYRFTPEGAQGGPLVGIGVLL
jgi:hypothetical protein